MTDFFVVETYHILFFSRLSFAFFISIYFSPNYIIFGLPLAENKIHF